MPVYGSEGDRVGEVERIILTQEGEVETIVVDVGGFLGLGEKPVAVSLDQLLAGEDEANGEMRLSVNHTEEELESMQAWEE
jgi:sporulation protein YlmC with PRC-barrel domain